MLLRPATPADLPALIALERAAEAALYVGQWPPERHAATLASPDARYFVVDAPSGGLAAYAILRGLAEDSGSIELKRLVVGQPGRGLGRQILTEILAFVFGQLHAHRLFLDVYDDNARARHLYTSLGFRQEGIMRHAARRDGQWHDLHLMSILEDEYRARD